MLSNNALIRKKRKILPKLRYDLRKNPALMIMMLPSVVYFIIFSYIPMIGIWFAFTSFDFRLGTFGSPYVGLQNFVYLFSSGKAWTITVNTIFYNIIFIFIGNALRIFFAILMSEVAGKIFKKSCQTLMFMPHFISMVIVGTFAYNLLNFDTGVINNILRSMNKPEYDFYINANVWMWLIPIFYFWKSTGYGTIVYMSTISGISDELYEAADLDGASFLQEIRYITLPCLRPTFIILVLMALGQIMRGQFDLFYQLIGETPRLYETTDIIDTFVFRSLRSTGVTVNRGTAVGIYQSIIGCLLIVTVNTIVRKAEPDYALF